MAPVEHRCNSFVGSTAPCSWLEWRQQGARGTAAGGRALHTLRLHAGAACPSGRRCRGGRALLLLQPGFISIQAGVHDPEVQRGDGRQQHGARVAQGKLRGLRDVTQQLHRGT